MVVRTTKSTELDAETAATLAALAQRWQTTPADALRRAILTAAREPALPQADTFTPAERLQALRELRASLAAQGVDFDAWAREAQAMREGESRQWQ